MTPLAPGSVPATMGRTMQRGTTKRAMCTGAASGHPTAEYIMLGVGFAGVVLALGQYGRGYRRAMLLLLGCATFGFLGGKAVWPLVLG